MDETRHLRQPVRVDLLKASFDRGASALALLLAAPVLGLAALAILADGLLWPKDRGPVFYRERHISAGRPFTLVKFRTMRLDAIHEVHAAGLTIKYLEREDRGHTRVGWYLRRFYLDELPQLINIFRGDMSFVGPRPPAPFEYERELAAGNVRKRLAQAGLVGLQQLHKGRTQGFEEEVALDYEYVARVARLSPARRLIYDVGILLRSLRVLLEGKGL